MRFPISTSLREALRSHRAMREWTWKQGVEETHDALLLDPGLGAAVYLTFDGRVLIDGSDWDEQEIREADEDEAIRSLVIGARKTGITDLIDLVPKRPETAVECSLCLGSRWMSLGTVEKTNAEIVCSSCSGRGWIHE